ncbi:MAG: hypothetical protein WC867_03435 [Candidatus Pacearchaeota archaeon]|jgi:hypothetical protein
MKKIFIFIFIIISINIIAAQEGNNSEKFNQLTKLGLLLDQNNFEDPDIDILSDHKLIVKKTGSTKPIDVSKVKGKMIIEFPEGGIIKDLINKGKKENPDTYVFNKGAKVTIFDGEVILDNVELKKGSFINSHSFSGNIKNYNRDTGDIFTAKGKDVFYDGFKYSTSKDGSFAIVYEGVRSDKESVITGPDGKIVGRFSEGWIDIEENGKRMIFSPNEGKTGVFINNKETKFTLKEPTEICPNGKCPDQENIEMNRIEYNGDLKITTSKKNNLANVVRSKTNEIGISAKDGSYDNIIIPEVADEAAKINLELLTKENNKIKKVSFEFSKDKAPIAKGNLANLKSNIANMYGIKDEKSEAWMLYKGEVIDGKAIGQIDNNAILNNLENLKSEDLKKLYIKTLDFNNINMNMLFDSAFMNLIDKPDLQNFLADQVLNTFYEPKYNNLIFIMAKNNPDLQKRIIDNVDIKKYSSWMVADLITAADSFDVQKKLLEKYEGYLEYQDIDLIRDHLKNSPNLDEIEKMIKQKANGIENLDEFGKMDADSQMKILETSRFYTSDSLKNAYENAKNDEIKTLILNNMKGDITNSEDFINLIKQSKGNEDLQNMLFDYYSASFLKGGGIVPTDIAQAVTNLEPTVARDLLKVYNEYAKLMVRKSDKPWFDSNSLSEIYSNKEFNSLTEGLEGEEKWSIALSISRRLEQKSLESGETNIQNTANEIMNYRKNYEDRVLLGPETDTFIPITNDERWSTTNGDEGVYRFQEDVLTKLATDSGVKPEAIKSGLKGPAAKTKILETIEQSKGSTTIYFNNHGGPEHQWLGEGQIGSETSDDFNNPLAISFQELGDSLIERSKNGESLSNLNIMIDSCYSYDFTKNLYSYLKENGRESVKDYPIITTETNRGKSGYSFAPETLEAQKSGIYSQYVYGLNNAKESGKPLTIGTVYKSEKYYFGSQDGAVFVPSNDGIITLGSSNDPNKQIEIIDNKIIIINPDLIPTVIEVGSIEKHAADKLV